MNPWRPISRLTGMVTGTAIAVAATAGLSSAAIAGARWDQFAQQFGLV